MGETIKDEKFYKLYNISSIDYFNLREKVKQVVDLQKTIIYKIERILNGGFPKNG